MKVEEELDDYLRTIFLADLEAAWPEPSLRAFREHKIKWQLEVISGPKSRRMYFLDFVQPWLGWSPVALKADLITSIEAKVFQRYLTGELSVQDLLQEGLLRLTIKNQREAINGYGEPLVPITQIRLAGLPLQRTFEKRDPTIRWTESSKQPWMPVRIWGRENALKVDWILRGDWSLREPFFLQTMKKRSALSFRQSTSAEELVAFSKNRKQKAPAAFIFHSSRCGSTLACQMLEQVPEVCMLSEPGILEQVFFLQNALIGRKTALFLSAMTAFSHAMTGRERQLVIKFSGGLDWLPWMQILYLNTPWIYLYRHPADVIRSNLRSPPAWCLSLPTEKERIKALAQRYEAQLDTVLRHADRAALIANYTEIDETFPVRLLHALNFPKRAHVVQKMKESLSWYAKVENVPWAEMHSREKKHAHKEIAVPSELLEKYERLELWRKNHCRS